MIIAFPPCTYLTAAGACRMHEKGKINKERYVKAQKARRFFMSILISDCERIAIENPTPLAVAKLPPCSSVIQPYQFGHPFSKRTCLWLKGLPPLVPTQIITENVTPYVCGGSYRADGTRRDRIGVAHSQKVRSKTFSGIAKAMAEQWASGIINTNEAYQLRLEL